LFCKKSTYVVISSFTNNPPGNILPLNLSKFCISKLELNKLSIFLTPYIISVNVLNLFIFSILLLDHIDAPCVLNKLFCLQKPPTHKLCNETALLLILLSVFIFLI